MYDEKPIKKKLDEGNPNDGKERENMDVEGKKGDEQANIMHLAISYLPLVSTMLVVLSNKERGLVL